MQQHPAHLPESFYLAGRGFVMGVALGLSGVIVHPFRGKLLTLVDGLDHGSGIVYLPSKYEHKIHLIDHEMHDLHS